jgi:hypothetical protein
MTSFNLSHQVKLSGNFGKLIPVGIFDVVPGDRINHRVNALLRTQPLLAPVMHTCDVDMHFFFVPDRIIWEDAEDFHSGGDDGMDTTVAPTISSPAVTGWTKSTLADYLGLALGVPLQACSALPFRAYAKIYNEFFRDSQLQSELVISMASGVDTTTSTALVSPCWKRDYFTKARPNPQLGPDVVVPLTGDAPIMYNDTAIVGGAGITGKHVVANNTGAGTGRFEYGDTAGVTSGVVPNSTEINMNADLTDVQAIDVRDLRELSAIQTFLERNNIWGGRYIEQVRARFGQIIPDFRLDRPEYLGGTGTKFQFSEVLQTGGTSAGASTGVGSMMGHGIALQGSSRYKYRVPEHGWIIALMSVRPKTQYMQGQHRMWNRTTKYDYLIPELERIGDQAILNKELYAAHATPDGVFGYTPQYDEYRSIPSRVAGDFRDSLKYWHMAREFSSAPALNSTFVTANPTNRIFTATSADQMYITVEHDILARRRLGPPRSGRLM